jgi:hypothetical protein
MTVLRLAAACGVALGCGRGETDAHPSPVPVHVPVPVPAIAADDAHNHDGSHAGAATDCGSDYMLPGEVARLGSHSFMILGRDGPSHVIADHRSGTPPHNYQLLLRVRLDEDELAAYERLARTSRTLPAFTTIYIDASGREVDRTFFCLSDLPDLSKIRFPIRASLQTNADHEGTFDVRGSVSRGDVLTIERADLAILVARYLPAYLPQEALRTAIRERPGEVLPRLDDAPVRADEDPATAAARPAASTTAAAPDRTCPRNTFLPGEPVPETVHAFLLLAAAGANAVLATHDYDHAPHNFQTAVTLTLTDEQMAAYRRAAAAAAPVPPRFQTTTTFCMQDLRKLLRQPAFALRGTLDGGAPLDVPAAGIRVLVNRRLESFLDPLAVARSVGDAR